MKKLRFILLACAFCQSSFTSELKAPQRPPSPSSNNSLLDQISLLKASQITLNSQLPQKPNAKDVGRFALGTGVALYGANHLFTETTRSIDGSTLLAMGIGSALTASFIYRLIGREMKLIMGFKGDLSQIALQYAQTQKDFALLKEQQIKVNEEVKNTKDKIGEMHDTVSKIATDSGGTAKVAAVIQNNIIPEIRDIERVVEQQQKTILELSHHLSEKQRKSILETVQIQNDVHKKVILKIYNKLRIRHRALTYQAIPNEWLTKHNYKQP